MKQKHNWLLDCCVKLKTKKGIHVCQSNQKKNRQIITFQAAKIQHKPRCVSLKNGENLNKICISALPLTPPYTQWCLNYFEVAFHFFSSHLPCPSISLKLFWTCSNCFRPGPKLFGLDKRWNSLVKGPV